MEENGAIADRQGGYDDFTGRISWHGTEGRVRKARFQLTDDGVVFERGIWLNGTWAGGRWQCGIWHDGVWHDGVWESGAWLGGTWKGGESVSVFSWSGKAEI